MRRILVSALVFIALGCLLQDANAQDYVVATIGEQKIYYSEIERSAAGLNKFLKENFNKDREWRLDYIRQYVAKNAVAKRAVEEGLDKDPQVQFDIEQSKKALLADTLLGRELAKIKYTQDDLKLYYEQNKSKYRTQEQASFSYIKVDTKSEAEKISAELAKGKSLDKLAGKNIQKTHSMPMIGPFVPEVKGASPEEIQGLFSMKKGECSKPLGGPEGYYIFRMDEKTEAKERAFEQVKNAIEGEYARILQDKVINEVVKETFAREKVIINEGEIR